MKKIFYLAGVLSAAILVFSGCQMQNSSSKTLYSGTVECESFYVSSEASGKLTELNVQQGSEIKEGQKIGQIDTKLYELQKNGAEASLKMAQAKLDDIPSNVSDSFKQQASSAVDSAQSAVDIAKLQIDRCAIKSSVNGVVQDVLVNKGEIVTPGMNIVKVNNINDKYVKVYVEESNRSMVQLNKEVKIISGGKQIALGKVVYISQESEFTPKNTQTKSAKEKTVFEVKIKVNNEKEVVPGLIVDVDFS